MCLSHEGVCVCVSLMRVCVCVNMLTSDYVDLISFFFIFLPWQHKLKQQRWKQTFDSIKWKIHSRLQVANCYDCSYLGSSYSVLLKTLDVRRLILACTI